MRGAEPYRPRRPAETLLNRLVARHVQRRSSRGELLRRVFLVDVLRCPRCGRRRGILAAITEGRVVRASLTALGLPTEAPVVHPVRGPPDELVWE